MALKYKNKRKPEDDEDDVKPSKKSKSREPEEEDDDNETSTEEDDDDTDADDTDSDADDSDDDKPKKRKPADDDDDDGESRPKKDKAKSGDKEKVKKKTGFLKTGKARQAMLAAADEKAKAREEQSGKLWRFYIPSKQLNEDFQITFLDGDLDEDGMLDNPTYHEHSVKINGRWTNFVSCIDDEPDPLALSGKEPYPAQAFTVIDHTPYEDREGKVHTHRKKLFVAKREIQKRLQKMATKRDGLKGCTFTVSRTGKKVTNVGDDWTFDEKRSMKELKQFLISEGVKKDKVDELLQPADYENELTYYSAKELKKMGIVDTANTISSKAANEDAEDLDEALG